MRKMMIAVAAVTAAAVLTCGCSEKKVSKKSYGEDVPEKPTEWTVDQLSTADILPLEGEEKPFIKYDEEDETVLRLVQGLLVDEIVNNENEALDIIAAYSKELGMVDVYSELVFRDKIKYGDEVCYRYDQYFNDIRVEDGIVELTVDMLTGNKPVILRSKYVDLWGFDTSSKLNASDASKCAKDKYKLDKSASPELTVIVPETEESEPELAWKVPVKDDKVTAVYINAKNGDLIK